MTRPELPEPTLLVGQAARLQGTLGRILRRLGVARRGPVIDLGAGHGAVTGGLVRRSKGPVVALDRNRDALIPSGDEGVSRAFDGGHRIVADGAALPFRDDSFSLVFAQATLMWVEDLHVVLQEVERVLALGGALVAVEPDFGGMMEWPAELGVGDVWKDALERAGADPLVGRKLVSAMSAAGLAVTVDMVPAPGVPRADRFDMLLGLPLTTEERSTVERARARDAAMANTKKLVHVPWFFVTGLKCGGKVRAR